MSVQFPDLQVLVPRSVDVGRVESTALHQQIHWQQALAHEQVSRAEQRLRQVRTKADDPLRTDPDRSAGGKGSGANRRQEAKDTSKNRRPPAGPTGYHIDLLV